MRFRPPAEHFPASSRKRRRDAGGEVHRSRRRRAWCNVLFFRSFLKNRRLLGGGAIRNVDAAKSSVADTSHSLPQRYSADTTSFSPEGLSIPRSREAQTDRRARAWFARVRWWNSTSDFIRATMTDNTMAAGAGSGNRHGLRICVRFGFR